MISPVPELLLGASSIFNFCTWSLMMSYSHPHFSWGKNPVMLSLYFPKRQTHVGPASSNSGSMNGWDVLTGPTVDASKNTELPFIFAVSDQSLPLTIPNYRKNSVWSRKLVLWIHISFVGQWSSCVWHNFCWHIVYSLFYFFFFLCQKKTISIQVTSGEGGQWFLCDLGRVISSPLAAVSLLQLFQLQCSASLWFCGCWTLLASHQIILFTWQREGLP